GRLVRESRPVRVVSGSPAASLKGMALNAKEKAQNAGRKVRRTGGSVYRKTRRAGRSVKMGPGKVGRAIRRPIDFVLKPFHLLGQAFNDLKEFFLKKLLLPLAVGAGVGVVLYTLLISMFSFLYGLGKTAGEAGQSLLGIRTEEDVKAWVELLNGKAGAVYQEAVEAAKGAPVSGTVYDGVRLYAYGSPKSADDETVGYYHRGEDIDPAKLNGWHIIYLDSAGNVIGNNTSNTKDIISLVAVMMDNSLEDSSEVKDFLGDMWEGMKPVLTLCESDIYHTEYSTDTFPFDGGDYKCTDENFYSHYASAVAEGVVMYDEAAEAHLGNVDSVENTDSGGYICSGRGCEYTEWEEWVLVCTQEEHGHSDACQVSRHMDSGGVACGDPAHCTEGNHYEEQDCDREEHIHSKEGGCYRQDIHRDYYCPGHTALHCSYGYRDINVYVTLLDKEDFFRADIDSGRAVMTYKKPVTAGGSLENAGNIPYGDSGIAFEECTAVVQFRAHFDGYKKRMKNFVNNGFWDYGEHLLHAVYNPGNGCVECVLNHLGDAYTLENKEVDPADKCIGAIEWVNQIYDADWLELYGVSVDSYDSGIAVGGTLDAAERAAIQEAIGLRYGDISSARQALIDTALGQVGAVRYYWGGKPVNAGMPLTVSLNGAGTAAVGASCVADRKGRAVAGLDCSGFVGWAYWTAFGVKPGMSTGTFTGSLGLEQINFGELEPGDIGLQAVPGAASNHIGIFLGLDENGKALWVHCSGNGGVVVNNTNCFQMYYRLM
ncbi:MAG: NlpC/P60 family protein, partial [Lachnospiraceae bacterium]|nr:NlpC/P60 family protein [Lachnospiraceae bacterium]